MNRYGIKGAVYLKSRDDQVLFVTSNNHTEWTSGNVVISDYTITVNSLLGMQTYRLFDHITVSEKCCK